MTAPQPSPQSRRALRRAQEAVRCLPFRLLFYQELEHGALGSSQLIGRSDWPELCRCKLSANRCEDLLIWLIQLGVLRREVDGQGLTERVRLTPLGREALSSWPDRIPSANALQRLRHWLQRHRPRL